MASTNIIANHTIVADYDKIPAYYMSEVKKMWFNLPGESHSVAYMTGLTNLEGIDANYAVNVTSSGTPEAYTSSHLRASRATWGDLNNATGWYYSYGEEDWFTSAAAINRTKAGITYCIQNDLSISAMGLGWCWDTNITATEINASYLPAMEEYIAYCTSMGYNTKMLFTTGPVDEYTGAIGYRQHMKYEAIRNYVNNHPNQGLALFDYADILCYDDNGDVSTATYDSSVYPIIATNNMGGGDVAHIGNNGATRLGKAVWWMMARIAGWNGSPQDNSTYYVSNAGNDASDGRTPQTAWRTIDKVNASMGSIQPGESVLFRRGDTFYGTINVTKSGTAENPITFGAYGTGDKPTITGFTDIMSGWASVGNGIYSRDIIADQQTNMLLIDGSQYAMGRWPKGTTYNTFESHDGSLSITDNTLPSAPDWTGADVVIRQNWWTQTRFKILDHNGTTIIYNDGSVPNATTEVYNNFGYFIQNDLSTLYIDPTYGEWYHDFAAQKLYVYFGAEDPSTKIVKVATKGNLVNNSTADYVTISNLNFIGCTSTALSFTQYMCTNITINDCSIQYAGLDGISDLGEDTSIYRNTIEYCNQGGIVFTGDNGRVQFNTIKNIGLLSGQAYMNGRSTAIRIGSTNAIVHSNYIQNIGYNGISGGTGTSASVKYNYIDNVCRTINDGGGIYHGQSNSVTPPGQWIIEYNIILNGYGNTLGTSTPTTYLAEGIYLDSYCRDASVRYNICANNRGTGIKIGSGRYNIIEDNLCFNNYEAQLYVLGSWSYPTIIDNTILRNQFIAKEATQLTLKVGLSASDNISNYGTSNYNIYARPIDDVSNSIYTTQTGGATNYRNISSWQTFSGEDANSRTSFTNVSSTNEILFYYNETNANKVVASLTSPMVDVSGNTYPVGNLTLAPWTGVVLMPNNDVSVYYLAADGSDNSGDGTIENPWFSLNKVWPLLEPGDTVYMRDGSYGYTYRQYLTGKNGTANARINIWAYPGENPHIVEPDDASFARNTGYVIYFKGDYFHWKGIEISNYKQLNYDEMTFPFRSEDSDHNIFELLTVHDCGFGIHIGGSSDDNLFLNCDVYNIYDPLSTSMIDGSLVADPYEDGDGFSIGYGGLGTTNTYRGCRAWNIADDGWDLWRSDSHVIIDRCWAWNCGYAPDGSIGGNGNGFKLGITETSTAWASNPPILRTITNSIAYGNRTCGVHQNGAYCAAEFYNNIAYKNGEFGFWMYSYNKPHIFKNNISFDNKYTAAITAESTVEYNTFLIGVNQSNSSYNVSNSDFLSIDASLLSSPRQANGDLPKIQFLHLTTGSDLIHSGTDISSLTYDGDGNLWHSPPSLGAFEFTEDYPTVLPYVATTNITNITTNSATGGGNVTDEGSSSVFAKGLCWNTSVNPTILNSSTNDGTGEGSYVSYITGLNPSTHYFARAYAMSDVGIAYGDNVEFDTLQLTPESSVYYIDPNGIDDSGRNGHVGQEWATLSYACSRVSTPGSTIYVNAGNYNETAQCNLSTGVSIIGAGRTTTKIIATSSLTRLIYASSAAGTNGNQTVSDITFDFNMNVSYGVQFFGRSNVTIERVGFENAIRYGLTVADVLGRSDTTEPTNWAINNIIRYCYFINCGTDNYASYTWEADAAINISGQENMLVYGNDIDNKLGNRYAYGIKGVLYGGFFKGLKIHDNKIRTNIRDVSGQQSFGFNIELWTGVGGNEIYRNDCNGAIDIGGYGWWDDYNYGYAINVYENILIQDTHPTNQPETGIILESGSRNGCYFYNNWVENFSTGFSLGTTANSLVLGYDGVWVTYNVFCNLGYTSGGIGAGIVGYNLSSGVTIKNYHVLNNVIHKINNAGGWGISYEYNTANNWENTNIKNNIVFNAYTPVQFRNQTVTSMYIHNNLTFGATRSIDNATSWENSTIILRDISNNLEGVDPLFVSIPSSDYHLQSGSPCINAGTNVGLTLDFDKLPVGTPPEIGAFEYFGQDTSINGTAYYVSVDGSDNNDGLTAATPWQTIDKVNASMGSLSPGDGILFKRGDTFYGSINITKTGTPGNPITFGAYGSGDKPVITGLTEITSWTNVGEGIYSTDVVCESSCNIVLVDGSIYAMGRWPNDEWRYYTETDGSTYIGDESLINGHIWEGGELVLRKNRWVIDRCLITAHDGSALYFTNGTAAYPASVGWGYFIQNHISTLDVFGEWYYDASSKKTYVYFGDENPSNHTVHVSTLNIGVYITTYTYRFITIDNLNFSGFNLSAIYFPEIIRNPVIQNCNIEFSGQYGIYAYHPESIIINNNSFNYINYAAIYINGSSSPIKITNNVITNTFLFPGMGLSGDNITAAIASMGTRPIITNNIIINTGYIPIRFTGTDSYVANNYINKYCFIKDDGAGIYIFNDRNLRKQVIDNIILNGIGAPEGTNAPGSSSANGLYTDGGTSNVTFTGNIVAYMGRQGYHGNLPVDVSLIGNTFFQCKELIGLWKFGYTHFFDGTGVFINGLNVQNNIFVSSQLNSNLAKGISYENSTTEMYGNDIYDEIKHLGKWHSNHYYVNEECFVYLAHNSYQTNAPYNLERWKSEFEFDVNSSFHKFDSYTLNSLGPNLIANGTFDSNINGWTASSADISLGWDNTDQLGTGGSMSLTSTQNNFYWWWWSNNNAARTSVIGGAIDSQKHYILRLLGKSDIDNKTLSFRLSSTGTGHEIQRLFAINSTATQKEVLLSNPENVASGATLRIVACDDPVTTYLDNIGLYEADITPINPDDVVHFIYNETDEPKEYFLSANMQDIRGNTYNAGVIDLSSWKSLILFGEGTVTEGGEPVSLPYVSTNTITDISTNYATGGGNVTHDGSTAVFAKGVCWSTLSDPTTYNASTNDGVGIGPYTSYLTNLNPSTHYFVRAYATNIVGTGYGENIEFITLAPGEEPPHPPVTLKTFLVNPYIQTRFYVSFAGKFYILPTDATAGPEPSTYLYKRTGPGWDEYGSWAYDQFCSSFESGCIYDVSFGIVTDNPAGHFTILSEKPSWITFYDIVTGHDLDVGDHISDDPDRVFKAHPNSENTSGVDRDGSIYITNDFGQSVTFFVTQYRQPTAPTIQILPDPSDQSGLDVSSYESATIDAGYDNAAIQGLYITVPGWTAGDLDVSWRAERIFPTLGNYGYGTIGFEHKDSSFSGALIFNDVAHSGDEFIIYLKTDPLITLYVSPSNINFLKSGGDASVNVTTISTNVWNASESYDWLTLTDASGTGSGQFTVTAEQQPDGGLRRNASIYVTSNNYTRTVSISQDPSVFLYFNPNSYTFGDAGGQHDISILTSQLNPWNVSTGANWLSFAGLTSGTGSANLTLWADSQPTSGASHRTTTVGCYSEASTATLYIDQEYLSFTEVVEMREYTFAWNYNQTEEQSSTITTSFDTTLPYWYITNEANIPSWITWGVYNGTELEPSSNYQSGFTLRVHPSANTGYTARTFVFDICTGSNLSNKSLSVWQGPAPQPVSVNVDSSGFTCTINSANAYANSPYISFSVTDFDGWNATYGIGTACYYTVIDASNITLINENMLTEHAEDADATIYTVTNAVMNRNAVAGDFLTVILYGYV